MNCAMSSLPVRLREIGPRAGAERLGGGGDARVPRPHHDDGVAVGLEGGTEDLHAGDRRHVQVDQHDVEPATPDELQRLISATEGGHVEAVHLEDAGAALAESAVVVDDQETQTRLELGRDRERIAGVALAGGEGAARVAEDGRGGHARASIRARQSSSCGNSAASMPKRRRRTAQG